MLIVKDLGGKPFIVSPDTQLNTRTGTVLIPNKTCPVDVSWPDCYFDLFELIADKLDITHVSCFIINPRGCSRYPATIAKNTFKGENLPDSVYIGEAFCDARCHPCVSPGHTHTNCPSTKCICANCTQKHNVFFRGCPVYQTESEVAVLSFKHDLTFKEARQKAHLSDFQQVPFSMHFH